MRNADDHAAETDPGVLEELEVARETDRRRSSTVSGEGSRIGLSVHHATNAHIAANTSIVRR